MGEIGGIPLSQLNAWIFTLHTLVPFSRKGKKKKRQALQKHVLINTGASFKCQASSSSQGSVNIKRFTMHPSEFALLPAAFGERERERVFCSKDGSHLSAQCTKTNFRWKPTQGKEFFFFFLCATFPFDILKAISSAMHTIALHNRTWNAAFLTLHWDKRQHLHDRMARLDYRTQTQTSLLEWFLWKGQSGKLRKLHKTKQWKTQKLGLAKSIRC